TNMSTPAKKPRTVSPLQLLYHPGIPGRGEYIRLVLEASGTPYTDVANSQKGGYDTVLSAMDPKSTTSLHNNPPIFAPPALLIPAENLSEATSGDPLLISQTPSILLHLSTHHSVLSPVPNTPANQAHTSQALHTALDLSNECHDVHHPIAVSLYYEDQKDAALRRATDFRENRLPKFLSYFERLLKGNEEGGKGKGRYLVGEGLTVADTTFWQVLDGLFFAFPKEMDARQKDYPLTFDTFYPGVKEEPGIKEYLASDRRLPYSMGLFRKYPELDRQ
ncbi:glutathione S-transferase, partial [Saccharata proteae CBS 121410]